MSGAFQLSASLAGHSQDVRAVASGGAGMICSASRDASVITWTRTDGASKWDSVNVIRSHDIKFVNAVAILPPSASHPQGLVISGGQDKIIHAADPLIPGDQPAYMLIGHTENVCALTVAANGDIISGSWDKTAKIWRDWNCLHTLEGHEASVWAVLSAGQDTVLTGSADKTIKLWRNGRNVQTYNGHTDAVRSLGWISQTGQFISAANDATVRIWNMDGQCVQELYGHTAFVYSVAVLPTGEIVSSGEDRTVRVWKGGDLVQTITHPCTSVWSVAALPDGDIVTGGSDALVRVFSRRSEALADAETIKDFNEAVANQAIPSNQVGDVNKDKLPGVEALSKSGKKDGDVIMIRNGNVVEAHQWEQTSSQWTKVGEVVDAIGSERKKIFNGREYDFVFDVDIGEGMPPLKLPYNASENPYFAAQQFLETNELSPNFLDQIAQFIIQNAKGVEIGTDSGPSDPYTGGGRYVPGQNSQAAPTTSSSINSSKGKAAVATSSLKEYASFKAANISAIRSKIQQFNNELSATPALQLDTSSLTILARVCTLLESAGATNSTVAFTVEDMGVVEKMAFEWPLNKRFPAVDLLRLCLAYSAQPILTHGATFIQKLLSLCPPGPQLSKEEETNLMLALRALANIYLHPAGRKVIASTRQQIFGAIKESWRGSVNKNLRLAFATVLLNASIHAAELPDESLAIDMVALILEFLIADNDSESTLRGLAALGTLAYNSSEGKSAAKALEASSQITSLAPRSAGADELKFREIANAVRSIIAS
ncbi:hypothetical protein SmJEL517_g05939 [Synchytrium microbalum]|uniref:Phospholipase A-2-activating protein n=1 Tax=Synchytrium microbalum TaxID=1806994 RepID=A0A507BXK5_9FUNG|nr:uncharacterized protein SmJEL517_g05939 [Synchytrium microbalum]TPX30514.1 hypothetical protein SmJEL517_g05939 [Synchytrium microbalum]